MSAVVAYRALVDAGEAEAIQLAKELHATHLLIDDYKGRQLAEREGLPAIGLIGVLLFAKQRGHIPMIRPLINRLRSEAHVYLSDEIASVVLRAAAE